MLDVKEREGYPLIHLTRNLFMIAPFPNHSLFYPFYKLDQNTKQDIHKYKL